MTTAELIRQLQTADPSGELPVCLANGGEDVRFVCREAGYYDGPYEQLVRGEDGRSISRAVLTTRGEKVRIHYSSIAEIMIDRPDFPVTIDVSEGRREEIERRVAQWRVEARAL